MLCIVVRHIGPGVYYLFCTMLCCECAWNWAQRWKNVIQKHEVHTNMHNRACMRAKTLVLHIFLTTLTSLKWRSQLFTYIATNTSYLCVVCSIESEHYQLLTILMKQNYSDTYTHTHTYHHHMPWYCIRRTPSGDEQMMETMMMTMARRIYNASFWRGKTL